MKLFFKVDKLVRDCPLFAWGSVSHYRSIDAQEYEARLKDKVLEEAKEVIECTSAQELVGELADLLEVMYALAALYQLTPEVIEAARQKRREARGGFEERRYCSMVEVEEGSEAYEYCIARPEKYPPIIDHPKDEIGS